MIWDYFMMIGMLAWAGAYLLVSRESKSWRRKYYDHKCRTRSWLGVIDVEADRRDTHTGLAIQKHVKRARKDLML